MTDGAESRPEPANLVFFPSRTDAERREEPPEPAAPRFVLASASPRRRTLLATLGVPFTVRVADVSEPLNEGMSADLQAMALAEEKARAVAVTAAGLPVLAADTIVVFRREQLGKPETADEARRMLRRMRGKPHRVVTGVALLTGRSDLSASVSTTVWMRPYTDAEIEAYIATGDPFDKAGSYAIQHPGFHPVARIAGCYCNVVGLPLWTVRALLQAALPDVVIVPPDLTIARCATCPRARAPR